MDALDAFRARSQQRSTDHGHGRAVIAELLDIDLDEPAKTEPQPDDDADDTPE